MYMYDSTMMLMMVMLMMMRIRMNDDDGLVMDHVINLIYLRLLHRPLLCSTRKLEKCAMHQQGAMHRHNGTTCTKCAMHHHSIMRAECAMHRHHVNKKKSPTKTTPGLAVNPRSIFCDVPEVIRKNKIPKTSQHRNSQSMEAWTTNNAYISKVLNFVLKNTFYL